MAGGWLARLGLRTREQRAWATYDWANSAFQCTIITAVFPIYFTSVASKGLPEATATEHFATATTIALTIIAVLSPILGAYADYAGAKKRLLAVFLAIGVVTTAAMYFIGEGEWKFAALLFIIANIGVSGSFVFYDSLLPHIARADEMDRVSSAGYALGYLGGGLLLALNLAWILKPAWFGLPDAGMDAAVVRQRGDLVARVFDPDVPPGARASCAALGSTCRRRASERLVPPARRHGA